MAYATDLAERQGRIDSLLAALARRRIGCAVLDRRDDLFYFTGYTGSDAVLVLAVRQRRGWLVTDARYVEEAAKSAPDMETVLWTGRFAEFVGRVVAKIGCRSAAYTPHSMTAAFFLILRDQVKRVKVWEDAGPDIAQLRAVKSPGEIRVLRQALACAEAAFQASRARWRVGMTETDVKHDLEWEM
ncbi:MAG: aminopeptidase P family N-terminal domain-containing protein, partial [Planctomycetes bacterium]|nr:aminopeptidase P family N-terminal domain-containing protein [Planctomycetota bacterium]